jgi:hypothetical protein
MIQRHPLMNFPAITQTEGYWDALRGGAAIPMRADIDPRGLTDVLEFAFILERIAPGVGRFRLAGMHLSDLMGMEVRGMPVTAMFLPQARKEISEIFEKVLETPSVAILDLQGDGGFGRARIEAKMLLAPLKNDFGDVNRILGGLQSVSAIGRQPRRFRVTGVTIRELDVPRTASAKMPARVGPVLASSGFAEAPASFQDAPDAKKPSTRKPGTGTPSLRLVVNNA